ncbi:PABP-interacting PAM2 motif-containing protein [Endozoicomonas sp. 2B-B]
MTYGPTSTNSATVSSSAPTFTTPQASKSSLNPNAEPFIPRSEQVKQGPQVPLSVRYPQTTAVQNIAPHTFQKQRIKDYSDETAMKVGKAYETLKKQDFIKAEEIFRTLLSENQGIQSQFGYQDIIIGLARSLKEQTVNKQIEACNILNQLRSKGPLNAFGASTIHNLDLTLSLCEEKIGLQLNAEARLLMLRNKRLNDNENALCVLSGNFDADIAMARVWQHLHKYSLSEKLLLNIRAELINSLLLNPYDVQKLHRHLHLVNLALVFLWQDMGQHKQAETLLLKMSKKHPEDTEVILCRPSGDHDIDLALARLWIFMGKHKLAERLLLKMSKKHPEDTEDILCRPSGDHDIDLALARLWIIMGKHKLAERLLLSTCGKQPDESWDYLCKPSGHHVIDLALVRLWQEMDKHQLSGRLLLNLCHKHPHDSEDSLCKPTGHPVIDIALVRHWELEGKYQLAERLLLNLCGTHPDANEDSLCKPCGNQEIDLARMRLGQLMGKHERSERLLLNMIGLHPNADEDSLCRPSGNHDIDMARVRVWQVIGKDELSERLLLNMIGLQPDADEDSLCKPSGNHEIDLARVRLWQDKSKYELSERLLLNMSGKYLCASEEELCRPCGNHLTDLSLARLWEFMDKDYLTERLLLNMSGKPPDADEGSLCKPCGNHSIDLALARLWELMDKHYLAERLLLNMSSKHPDDSDDRLCMPCGNHLIDQTLVRLWQRTGKYEWAKELITRCCDVYPSSECELALLSLSAGQAGFLEMISRYPENANTLLTCSIHYFRLACEQITEGVPGSGKDNLNKALGLVESALEKYPPSAGAYSQKAHCLRMMGASEKEWKQWFQKANFLEPNRLQRSKTDFWRSKESSALQKLRDLKE